jgi:Uncharacterized conserved protein (DUF2249)
MIELRDAHPLVKFWAEGQTYHVDVRELLEQGGEPYLYIMECVNQIAADDTLIIHALFEPKPLVSQLSRMEFLTQVKREDAEHWTLTVQPRG